MRRGRRAGAAGAGRRLRPPAGADRSWSIEARARGLVGPGFGVVPQKETGHAATHPIENHFPAVDGVRGRRGGADACARATRGDSGAGPAGAAGRTRAAGAPRALRAAGTLPRRTPRRRRARTPARPASAAEPRHRRPPRHRHRPHHRHHAAPRGRPGRACAATGASAASPPRSDEVVLRLKSPATESEAVENALRVLQTQLRQIDEQTAAARPSSRHRTAPSWRGRARSSKSWCR